MDLDNTKVPNRGVHNMLDVAWLVGLVLGALALSPFMQGVNPPLIVTTLAIGAALVFAIRLYADRWVDAHPCATIDVRRGVCSPGDEPTRHATLRGPVGATYTIHTAFHDEETLHWVRDRVRRAIAKQSSPALVSEALRRHRELER